MTNAPAGRREQRRTQGDVSEHGGAHLGMDAVGSDHEVEVGRVFRPDSHLDGVVGDPTVRHADAPFRDGGVQVRAEKGQQITAAHASRTVGLTPERRLVDLEDQPVVRGAVLAAPDRFGDGGQAVRDAEVAQGADRVAGQVESEPRVRWAGGPVDNANRDSPLGARSGHREPGDPSTHDEDPSFGTVWHGRLRPRRFYRPWSTLASSPARGGAADVAGPTVPTIAGPATGAATLTLADTVDALRYALGGPCVTALLEPDPVQDADDLDAEDRWPSSLPRRPTKPRSAASCPPARVHPELRPRYRRRGRARHDRAGGPCTGQVVDLWAASSAVYAVGRRAAMRAVGDSPAYRTTSRVR